MKRTDDVSSVVMKSEQNDPWTLLERAYVLAEEGDLRAAVETLEVVVRAKEADDAARADAHHALGLLCQNWGDLDGMIEHFKGTLALDALEERPAFALDLDHYERVCLDALAELPDEAQRHLANVPVFILGQPSLTQIEDGLSPRLLGLFSGVPLPHKSGFGGSPFMDRIHLFFRGLEAMCTTREQLIKQVRITVLHETAHFFGLDDEDLDRLGLG